MPPLEDSDIPFNQTARFPEVIGGTSSSRVDRVVRNVTPFSPSAGSGPGVFLKMFFFLGLALLCILVIGYYYPRLEKSLGNQAAAPPMPAQSPTAAERADQLYAQALQLKKEGKFPEAVQAFQEVIQLRPNFPYASHNLAHVFEEQGKLPQSLEAMSRAVALEAADSQHYFCRGRIYFNLGNYQEAATDFEKAIKYKADFAEAFHLLGHTYERMGDLEKGLAQIKQAMELEPENEKYRVCHQRLSDRNQSNGKMDRPEDGVSDQGK